MTARPPPRLPAGFLPRVEASRGVAALTVCAYHAMIVTGTTLTAGFTLFSFRTPELAQVNTFVALFNGFGGVIFFFVLSGFILSRALDGQIDRRSDWLRGFVVSRIFRLAPASTVTILVFTAAFLLLGISVAGADFTFGNVLRNIFMLRSDIDGVMWSLRVEWVATPLIVIGVLAFRARQRVLITGLALALIGLSFVPVWTRALEGANLGPIYAFLFGMSVWFAQDTVARAVQRPGAGLFAIGCLVLFCAARPLLGIGSWTILIESICSTVFLAMVLFSRSAVLSFLDWPVARFFGRISYSLYLVHPLTFDLISAPADLLLVQELKALGVPTFVTGLVMSVATVAVITPLAWLIWRFVEQPGIALGKLVTGAPVPVRRLATN